MKVLVTGGAGFIGSHITDMLVENGHDVVIVDNLVTGSKNNLNNNAKFYEMDILDSRLSEVFNLEKPECVIHQAAQANAGKSLVEPVFDGMTNIVGTLNVLENCKKYRTERIIYASSAAIYGNPQSLPVTEQHPIRPISGYGVSKYTPEQYMDIYSRLYGVKHMILRYANVYGPRQNCGGEGGVASIFVDNLKKGNQVHIFGDGRQTRDFVYVKDVAKANINAMTYTINDTVNISTGIATEINQLFNILKTLVGISTEPVNMPAKQGDIRYSCLDNSKARKLLKWSPEYTLQMGLKEMVLG